MPLLKEIGDVYSIEGIEYSGKELRKVLRDIKGYKLYFIPALSSLHIEGIKGEYLLKPALSSP